MKNKIKSWLITKLAGDTTVILNTTIIYKYFPIFANILENPIIDKNNIIKNDVVTPFQIFGKSIFETVDDELKIKDEYLEAYNNAIKDIQNKTKEEKPKNEP